MRLNIIVDDDLMVRFKVVCARDRTTQADVVRDLIEQWTTQKEIEQGERQKS